jgi:thioredoxin-related protein
MFSLPQGKTGFARGDDDAFGGEWSGVHGLDERSRKLNRIVQIDNAYAGRSPRWKPWYSNDFGQLRRLILAWLLLLTSALGSMPATAEPRPGSSLIETRDIANDARLAAAKGKPLVVLYSRDDCLWCEKLRREHLGPLARDPNALAVVRELHIDRTTPLVDFTGRRTTSADFAMEMKARFAPTVMFHGPDGQLLAESIVGFRLADFYGAYLERAILDSRAKLRGEN